MTGPGEGKIKLQAKVYLAFDGEEELLDGAEVYVHVKGYSLARVTHLDIEHPSLNAIIAPSSGRYLLIKGLDGGIAIHFKKARIKVLNDEVNAVLKNREWTVTWVGGKVGGVYVGFKREHVRRLEGLARELGVEPR